MFFSPISTWDLIWNLKSLIFPYFFINLFDLSSFPIGTSSWAILGILNNNPILLSIGLGILAYGLIYICLHDIMVHKRLGFSIKPTNKYLMKIKHSHLKHHSNKTKNGATNFGFISYKWATIIVYFSYHLLYHLHSHFIIK